MKKTKVGIIGCGNISSIYCKTLKKMANTDLAVVADLLPERAEGRAKEFEIARACTVEQLLADPEIKIVVNLTIPKAHAEVALQVIKAGKSVYNEKPLAETREQAKAMLKLAAQKKVRIGCAPDTFLGAGIQTCRKLIEDGWIGTPVASTAFMMCRGHESWHPDPDFYYQTGGGPMFDMGPYYLTALINLMGPIRRISGSARVTFPQRLITSQPKSGTLIKVNTPTHIAGVMDFKNGAVGTIITSFDVCAHSHSCIEVYGTTGSIIVPDPNGFGGEVKVRRQGAKEWQSVPHTHGYPENSRGLGVADMAAALQSGRAHRASGELAAHVLDAMQAFLDASDTGKAVTLGTTCAQPAPMPMNLRDGEVEA
ncbi:MAG: Gfo/Idh/MocA family oxidoreductase [Kiritimatiellia bacterium]